MYTYSRGQGWLPQSPEWERTPNSNMTGSSLQRYLDGFKGSVSELFGKPDPNGYVDDEKGYDGSDYHFTEKSTGQTVNLYARWGEWRIGSHNRETAERFYCWMVQTYPGSFTL